MNIAPSGGGAILISCGGLFVALDLCFWGGLQSGFVGSEFLRVLRRNRNCCWIIWMKKSILLCMMDLPFPVRKNGISIRYYPIIEHLAKTHDIDLLVVSNNEIDACDIEEAEQVVNRCQIYLRTPSQVSFWRKVGVRLRTLLPGVPPFPMYCYDQDQISEFIGRMVAGKHYDVALTVCPQYAHLVLKHVSAGRFVMDAIDSVYVYMIRTETVGLFDRIDASRMRKWEQSLVLGMDYTSYVSPRDVSLMGASFSSAKLGVIPNGIFAADYLDTAVASEGFTLGFLGHMGYTPNVEAACRLATIFADLRKQFSQLNLCIIGRKPAASVQALGSIEGVAVTGDVKNIWPYVNSVDLFVFPMVSGAGQQNKVLEAMYAGIPVITSSVGNGGIGATNWESVVIADHDDEIKAAITTLMADADARVKIGEAGKKLVREKFYWPAIFAEIDKHYLSGIE